MATVEDAEFKADAARAGAAMSPLSGAELQKVVAKVVGAQPELIARMRTILQPAKH